MKPRKIRRSDDGKGWIAPEPAPRRARFSLEPKEFFNAGAIVGRAHDTGETRLDEAGLRRLFIGEQRKNHQTAIAIFARLAISDARAASQKFRGKPSRLLRISSVALIRLRHFDIRENCLAPIGKNEMLSIDKLAWRQHIDRLEIAGRRLARKDAGETYREKGQTPEASVPHALAAGALECSAMIAASVRLRTPSA